MADTNAKQASPGAGSPHGTNDNDALIPGEHLRQEMVRLGFDQGALAQQVEVSRQTVNNIINGRQNISRAMAAKLGRLMGRSSDYWLAARFPVAGTVNTATTAETARPAAGNIAATQGTHGGAAILVDHQIARAVKEGVFVIDPFVEDNVRSASVDLTLDDFIIKADGTKVDISDLDSFPLKAGEMVTVNTRENIELPIDYIGRVGAMTEYARYGIFLAHGFQVDPGFRGHLQFSLFNAGTGEFKLSAGRRIISLEICPLNAVPQSAYSGDEAPIDARRDEIQHYFRIKDATSICAQPIFDYLKSRVKIDDLQDRRCATLDELEIEMTSVDADIAVDGVIRGALDALRTRIKAAPSSHSDNIVNFFMKMARHIYLGGDEVRAALSVFSVETVGSGDSVLVSRCGSSNILAIPPQDAEITLQYFADQLRIEAPIMILLMTGLVNYADIDD